MKKDVQRVMAENNIKTHVRGAVPTRFAFNAWGLDIDDLTERLRQIQNLGAISPNRNDSDNQKTSTFPIGESP
jgi:hypothetical protein